LKPFDVSGCDKFKIPNDRKVLFRRLKFSPAYHKIYIELSRRNQKFYVVVKRYKNDKYTYYAHELYCVQARRLLSKFGNDYQQLIDATVCINFRKGMPPVDFSLMDKYLRQITSDDRRSHSEMVV
jgi:hypothetical protein